MTTITVAGKHLSIEPVKVRDLPAFLAAVEPILGELAKGDVLAAIARHADRVIAAAAIGAGVERAWLEEQTPDALVEIAAAVLEVNADFFVRRVLPVIQTTAARLTQSVQTASGGTSL